MFALIDCRDCTGTGEYARKRGDTIPCTSCNGTGVYQLIELTEAQKMKGNPHGASIMVGVGKKRVMARLYDPVADILTSA